MTSIKIPSLSKAKSAFVRLILATLLFAVPLRAEVVINEFVASNGSVLMDEDGDFEDWIELHNTGDQPVNLQEWGISDDLDNPFRWTFPSMVIDPGEYLIVWASGKDRGFEDENGEDNGEVAAPVAPDEVDGLVSWYRADALDGFQDGDPVAIWADGSGLGNDATQGNSQDRPTYQANALGGMPALAFNGNNQQFDLPRETFTGMDNLENFTLIAVARWDGGIRSGLLGTGPSNTTAGNTHFEITSGGSLRLRIGAMNDITTGNLLSPGEWNLYGASQATDADDALARIYLNGEVVGSKPEDPGNVTLAEYGGLFLGNSHDSSRNFDGLIAEVILYNHPLSPEQRRGVESHLRQKYELDESPPPMTASVHTNFRISSDGEPLLLTRPDGSRADEVAPVTLPRDVSYGRSPDGTGEWFYFAEPTPLEPNTTQAYSAPLTPPEFSQTRGFYETPFELTLSHGDPEAEIRFTLDGSPPSQSTGTLYDGPIVIDGNSVVRAVAYKDGALPVPHVMTHSYLFLEEVIAQPDDPEALGFPDAWGSWTAVHYGMTPEVTEDPAYAPRMEEALTAIPTLSLVIDMDDMFDPDTGLYANRTRKGFAWERPVSMELIHPNGDPSFQINAGLRAQGGASRNVQRTPKGSLRLLFKSLYEARRLEYPFFLSSGSDMDDFNTITLRAEYNNEWLHPNGIGGGDQRSRGQYVRDRFIRAQQIEMTGSGSHSKHVHLYINGVYWGLYNPSERIDAAFGANYFGGEREDWDAFTHRGVRDGNRAAWDAMVGLNNNLESLENYEAIQEYLDVPHYIDYMIVNMWSGMHDWPHNNWNAIRRREPGAGWKFFCWDSERSMENLDDNRINVSADAAQFYAELRDNAEFRLLFADHVHRHLFNGGALTPERTIPHYSRLAAIVEAPVIAESARWGNYRRDKHQVNEPFDVLYTRDEHWQNEFDRLINDYLPYRTEVVIDQFRNAGLYPEVAAPSFEPHGATFVSSGTVSIDAPEGTVYYTLDGTDPRAYGTGEVSVTALEGAEELTIEGDTVLKARVLHNGEWSALNEATYTLAPLTPHPLASGPYSFDSWDPDSPAGTYPANMIFEQVQQGDPALNVEMDGFWELPYNLTSRSRINGLGNQGISFINTGNAQAVEGAGYLGSARLALDASGENDIHVQWTGGTVTPNDRHYALRLQYRVGASDPFNDVTDSQGLPVEYLRSGETGDARSFGPTLLPEAVDGQPYVELRWKYYHVLGDSGPRAELRLDNILVASGDPGEATALAFDTQPPVAAQSHMELPPVLVRASTQDGFTDTTFTGEVTLALSPEEAGTLTGATTVEAVDGVATFEGLSVDGAGAFTLHAEAADLEPATSDTFRVIRLTELVMPRYIQGEQDATNDNYNRVPFAFRLALEGLRPNSVYRYGNRIIADNDPRDQDGAGNAIYLTGQDLNWIRNTDSPRFRPGDFGSRHMLFTTDSEGAYTGWFVTEPTGNARFTPGNEVRVRLLLNDGADGEDYHHFLTGESEVRVIAFGGEPDEATGVVGESVFGAKQFVALYDNEEGTGRPLAATVVEITGAQVDDRYAPFYHETVSTTPNLWGTLIPNDLTTGIRRIEERSLEDGTLLAVGTFPDGIAATVHPSGGIDPLVLDEKAAQSYALWVDRLPDPDDRQAFSDPDADPWKEGIPNLLRYALDIHPGEPVPQSLPVLEIVDDRLSLLFRRSPSKADIAYIVEASADLIDWSETLYDSADDDRANTDGEKMRILDSVPISASSTHRFLRLRIIGEFD